MPDSAIVPVRRVESLLTAEEAFPAFEHLFLNAQESIFLGMRIFDPRTRLHSPEALAIGEDWFDLIVHTLARGVRLHLVISDFDPIVRPDYHQRATRCFRLLISAGEVSGHPDLLHVETATHPARVGFLPSLALWYSARKYMNETVEALNDLGEKPRQRRLNELPMLLPYLRIDGDKVKIRPFKVPRLAAVTHHQKLAVADGETLYIGGLDLNDRRFDTPDHDRPANETWHDTQLILHGPAAKDAETHLQTFTDVVNGAPALRLPSILRTISSRRSFEWPFISPREVLSEIAGAHFEHVKSAKKFIYLESQFFRDRAFANALSRAARRNPDLKLLLVLPAAPDDIAFGGNTGRDAKYGEYLQAINIRKIHRAFGPRVFVGSPAQQRAAKGDSRATAYGAPIVYLHAKVSIFDDDYGLISSANLNGRSFRWDTEAGVALTDADDVHSLLRRCMAHWQGGELPDGFADPDTAVEAWRDRARENARLEPEDRKGYILPYSSAPARRFGRNLPGIPEEMV